jgi:hypothetical protein
VLGVVAGEVVEWLLDAIDLIIIRELAKLRI